MNDDIFKIKPSKAAVIEDDDKFIIYSQTEIMQKMRMLQKSRCLVTAYFDDGKQTLLTAVVDVLTDKKMILLDYGPDEAMNNALASARKVVFKSQMNGVTAKFTARDVKKARYQGKSVFACAIPEDLLWVQRRDTYRIKVPMTLNAFCVVPHISSNAKQYRIHDISVGGLALEDPGNNQEFALGAKFEKCDITLPEHGTGSVTLEVRSLLQANPDNPKAGRKIGCLFHDMRSDVDAMIQRFIHEIDSQHRKLEDD